MLRAFRSHRPRVDPSAFVDPSAQVVGDVEIGPESSVWMNAVVRGDVNRVRIGRRTNVQDGAVVHVTHGAHPASIGDEVTVGHLAILHGCTVGDRTLVGMGAIVLDGAEIGEESLVGAGTLVLENARIPPRSLVVGRPGARRRELSADEIEQLRESAARYVALRQDYR